MTLPPPSLLGRERNELDWMRMQPSKVTAPSLTGRAGGESWGESPSFIIYNLPLLMLLPPAYLAPVSWYLAAAHAGSVTIDPRAPYVKQTLRNRCQIAMPDGPQNLIIPIEAAAPGTPMQDTRISEHGRWRHHHWSALRTAYGKSPFFEFYADDFAPFYLTQRHRFLLDFDLELHHLVCSLIDLELFLAPLDAPSCQTLPPLSQDSPLIEESKSYQPKHSVSSSSHPEGQAMEGAECISLDEGLIAAFKGDCSLPNREGGGRVRQGGGSSWPTPSSIPPYYQVFAPRLGFLSDLSIVDLLFNLGPESLLYLTRSQE